MWPGRWSFRCLYKLYGDGWKFALSVSPALQREREERERGSEWGEITKGQSVKSQSYTFKKCWWVLLLPIKGFYSWKALKVDHFCLSEWDFDLPTSLVLFFCEASPFEKTEWRTHTLRIRKTAWPTSASMRPQAFLQTRWREAKTSMDSTVRKPGHMDGGMQWIESY